MSMATALPKTQSGTGIGADLGEDTAISVRNLKTHFFLEESTLKAVDNVSFDVKNGATVGIIGESGSGKSVTARSILRIVPKPGRIVGGEILARSSTLGVVDMAKLKESGEKIRYVPVPLNLPVRCGFYGRCPVAIEGLCDRALPALVGDASGHAARCFQVHDEVEESQDE